MKQYVITSLLAFSLVLAAFSQSKIKYYRNLGVDPRYGSLIGINQVSKLNCKSIYCFQFSFDNEKRIQRIFALSNGKTPSENNGYFDLRTEYDKGFEKKTKYNSKGQIITKNRVSAILYELKDQKFIKSFTNLDADGKPVADTDGIVGCKWQLDERGRRISEKYYTFKGQLQENNTSGYYEKRFKWGKSNTNFVEESYWDQNGKLTDKPDGSPYILKKYDNNWNVIESRCLDENRCLVENYLGYAICKIKYDSTSNTKTELKFLGKTGKLKEIKAGYAGITYKLDKLGRVVKESYMGANWKLKCIDGIATTKMEYDEQGNTTKISYWDANQLRMEGVGGISAYTMKYDSAGNVIEERNYGTNGKLKEVSYAHCAICSYKYDSAANKIEEKHFGVDEKLKVDSDGTAIIQWKYDSFGNIIEERHYGINQLLVDIKGQTAIIRFKYDNSSNLLSTTYFDANNNIISDSKVE